MPIKTTSCSSASSSLNSSPSKKLLFRRRRSRSSEVPKLTRTASSSSYSFESSSASSFSLEKTLSKKRTSFLSRILPGGGKLSPTACKQQQPHHHQVQVSAVPDLTQRDTSHSEGDNDDHSSSEDTACLATHALEEAVRLEERGLRERETGDLKAAMRTWKEALMVAQEGSSSEEVSQRILCRLISLCLRVQLSSGQIEEAAALVSQLKTEHDSTNAQFLEPSPVLVELLMHHSLWSLALAMAGQLPSSTSMDALQIARLQLENALTIVEGELLTEKRRAEAMSHLSECHQLLLSCPKEQIGTEKDKNAYLDLWQELAQAYSMRGEEQLALGCIHSRLEHLTSPTEVALAHYEQALHVYLPVQQYEKALKEANVALNILLNNSASSKQEESSSDDEEKTLLLLKLYQFKADVLCRLKRLGEGIRQYELLLQAYLNSAKHGPADAANVCYILGKLNVRVRRFENAMVCFERELKLTQSVVGKYHLAISKVLHELAKVADEGLMDYERSLQYYKQALQVETSVYKQLQKQQGNNNNNTTIKSLVQEAKQQIAETKRCLGKVHFKMGDFNAALKATLAVDR